MTFVLQSLEFSVVSKFKSKSRWEAIFICINFLLFYSCLFFSFFFLKRTFMLIDIVRWGWNLVFIRLRSTQFENLSFWKKIWHIYRSIMYKCNSGIMYNAFWFYFLHSNAMPIQVWQFKLIPKSCSFYTCKVATLSTLSLLPKNTAPNARIA